MENKIHKEDCITEKAFLECKCDRCKNYRESMISQTINRMIFSIISKTIDNVFEKDKLKGGQNE